MQVKQLDIALYGRDFGGEHAEKLQTLLQILQEKSNIHIYTPFLESLEQTPDKQSANIFATRFTSIDDMHKSTDCLLSIGGDGTFLEASQFAVAHKIPILGINFGRLGFLAQVPAEKIEPAMNDLFAKNYTIEKRSLISVSEINDPTAFNHSAVNEIAILRSNPTMLNTTVWGDGELLSSFWSDGVIISTPTGSTAYSLSSGGPVLTPDNRSLVITPIAPHNLNIRPIVISDSAEIAIKTETRKGNATLSMDNRMIEILSGTELIIKKSQNVLNFIKLKNYNFFKTLQNKLNWGIDLRN